MAAKDSGSNTPNKVGPARMWKMGSPGGAAANPPPGSKSMLSRNTTVISRGGKVTVSQGPTNSPNGTKQLGKKK